jgi:hypothetical protein
MPAHIQEQVSYGVGFRIKISAKGCSGHEVVCIHEGKPPDRLPYLVSRTPVFLKWRIGKRFAVAEHVENQQANGAVGPSSMMEHLKRSSGMKIGETLLVLGHCTAKAGWGKVLRSMGALIAERKGYSPLQVQNGLERILQSPGQPALYGGTLASFQGRMIGLLEPLVVVALIPAAAGQNPSKAQHVLLRAALPVTSKAEQRLVSRLDACLSDQETLGRLLSTRSASDFASALLGALESPQCPPDAPPQSRLKKVGINTKEGTVSDTTTPEINFNLVQVWVERAEKNASRCYVCLRIAQGNRDLGEFRSIKICGVDFSPESQIAHLSRCVGKGSRSA